MKRKIIDAALNELTGSYESYNPDIDKHLNENDFSHYSLEELTLKQDQYFKNADRLYAIMNKIKKEGKVNKFVGLEAASICKEMNINVGLEEYTVSNESVNIPLIAMIAGAILVVAAIISKIWGIITGGGSGDSGGGGGGGSPEVKSEAIKTTLKVSEVTQESNPKVKDAVKQTDSIYASAMKEIRTKKLEELKKYSAYPTLFDYLDNLPEDGENFGIPAILNGLKTSANLVPRLLFSELSNDFFGRFKTVFDKTIEIKKQIEPIYTAIDESILTMNTAFWDAISSHKDGPGKALEAVDKAIASLTNLTVEEELITQITDARNAIEEEGFHGDLPEMKTVNSAIVFNYFGSPLAKQCAEVIKEYDAFNASIFDKLSSLPKDLKNLNDDIVQLENNFKKTDVTEFYKAYPEVEGKVNTYLDLVKTSTRTLGNISSIVAKSIMQAQNFADSYFKLENAINHFATVAPGALKDLRRKLNDYGDDATDKVKELIKSIDKLILLIKERNISIKDVIGDVGKFKDLDNKDVFKSFLTFNSNMMIKFLEKDYAKFKTDEAGMEKYVRPKITYLPTIENYQFSQESYQMNGYKVTDLNGIKVNKMYTGVNTTSLENFIIETNLYNEIEIEQKASLENYFNSFEIDSQNLDNYFSKVDQLMSINNRIRNSGGITKSLGLEAIEVCSDLNIDIKKLSTYPSKIGYSASLEAIGVGVFALIIAAVVAVSMVLKKIWNFLMSDGGSSDGGGGGSSFPEPKAVEEKIEKIELTAKVDKKINENKEVVEEKIEQVGEAIKDTAKDSVVKEAIATVEKELSPLVKYIMIDSSHNNIFELLDSLPKEDFAYGPLVSVTEQLNSLKSFEKEIILSQIDSSLVTDIFTISSKILPLIEKIVTISRSTAEEFDKIDQVLSRMISEKVPADKRAEFFEREYKPDNNAPFDFSEVDSFKQATTEIKDYINNTNLDNTNLGIINLYTKQKDSQQKTYMDEVNGYAELLKVASDHKLVETITVSEKSIKLSAESIEKKLISAGIIGSDGTVDSSASFFINAVSGHQATFEFIQEFIIVYGKIALTIESIIASELKINTIIETYLSAAAGQLVEFKKRLKSDLKGIDVKYLENDNFKNRIKILYQQIDSLIEVLNGANIEIIDIIEKDPAYADIKSNRDKFSVFLKRAVMINKHVISAPTPSSETFDIVLRSNYSVMKYSLESHNAGYMAIIITGVVFVISVLSAILRKLFGGSSKDSSGGSTASASKAVKTNKYLNEIYSDINPVADFNFGFNNLDYSRLIKPADWTDAKFSVVKTTAEILKSSGDRGIFAVSETYINIAEDRAHGKDKAIYIENKINALGATVATMIYSKTVIPALTNICNASGPLFSKASEYCFTRNKTKELFDLVFNKEMTAEIIDKAIKIIKDDLPTLQTLKVDLENQIDNLAYHEEMEIHAKSSLDDFMKGAHSALSDKGFQNAMASVGNHMADYAAKNQEFITDSEQFAKKIENEKETIKDSDELADKNEEFKALNKEYTQLTIDIGKLCAKIMVSIMKFTQASITITSYYADVSSQILQLLIILLSDLQKCNIDVGSQAEAILKTTNKYIDRLEKQKDSLKSVISNNKYADESMWFKNYGSLDNYTAKVLGGMNNAKKIAQEVIDNDIG